MSDCDPVCQHECSWVFARVRIWHVTTGGTRVEWNLHPNFIEPQPHTFQLQVGRTGVTGANDWVDVGLPVTNTYYAIDDSQRLHGLTGWTHYRIKLTTPVAIHYSSPAWILGDLDRRDWLKWKGAVRQQLFQFKSGQGREGLLLKRKLYGTPCSCLDMATLEVRKPQHAECYGTGFLGGYFDPEPCVWVEMSLESTNEVLDGGQSRGTVSDVVVPGVMLGTPQLFDKDVWIETGSDTRYFIGNIRHQSEIRGVPVSVLVDLKPAPYSNVIYQWPVPGINA